MPDAGAPPQELEAGAKLGGGYEVVEPISRGAMGAVYRAVAEGGEEVALKQLLDPSEAVRFEIEARLLSGLRHPRVVRVLNSFHEPPGSYLVMELVRGTDLGRLVEERATPGLPVEEALGYGEQACEALQYVHEQQIVHRDVKPRNLILSAHGIVLVDFGIARQMGDDAGTRAVGTPRYMAPEVLVGESVSPRSDIYGLAATVWALLSGEPPVYNDPTMLAETIDGVSPELERALRRALDLRPERRFGSAAAMAVALGSPLEALGGESLSASLPRTGSDLLEAVVRTAAGVFEAAAASIALIDETTEELVYQAAWGAGAEEIVGVRLGRGEGIAGAAATSGDAAVVPHCRTDPRFAARIAAGTGYVPNTMLVVPLEREGRVVGVLSILDRRDGGPYGQADLPRAQLFAELAVATIP